MDWRRGAASGLVLATLAASGCSLSGGTTPGAVGPTPAPGASAGVTPTPAPEPTPLQASQAASPGATLALLPDTRSGQALDVPLIVRGLAVINRDHPVSSAYAPKVTGEAQLVPQASQAYAAMIAAAKADGASIIWRVGYRSYDTQQALSATPPTFYGKDADSYVAKPGRSEHQAGLAVDVASEQGYGTRFPETKEFAWLRANSYKYGFILRYPHDKTDITGYNYESWHYRYVGVEAAAAFGPNSELTLEEYLGGR